jgi:hypothetical protein
MFKKINNDWYLVGLLPLSFGILNYIFVVIDHNSFWEFFWICPLTAVATGLAVLSRNRFAISATIAWLFNGPFFVILFTINKITDIKQFHHIFSVLTFFIILYHWKKIWNAKGFLFGSYSFYAYITITSSLSDGEINFLNQFLWPSQFLLCLGIFYTIASVAVFFWHRRDKSIHNCL